MTSLHRHILAFACALVAACSLCAPAHDLAHADEPQHVPLLMIVIEFNDGAEAGPVPYESGFDWSEATFNAENSLAAYYSEMSGGAFTFVPAGETSAAGSDGNHNDFDAENDGIIHVTLAEPHGAWGLVNENASVAQEFGRVVLRAFQASSAYVDYASFDANGDSLLSPNELAVCICVAGYDASSVSDPSRSDIPLLWPHAGYLANNGGSEEEADGMLLDSYIAIPELLWYDTDPPDVVEQEPLGILYHELGHYLGLPDLYALNANSESEAWGGYSVGMLSLMDNGGWATIPESGGYRYAPTAFDAWCRYVLGWSAPQVVTKSGDYAVSSQLSENGYCALLIPTKDPEQYFLVENRQPEGYDEALSSQYADGNPGGGIVIWHIDKGAYHAYGRANTVNDTTHRPAIMETYLERSAADGTASFDWAISRPDTLQPFYDSRSCEANLGDPLATIELPLYGSVANGDHPASRVASGIRLQFPTASGRDMTVHIELPEEPLATCQQAYTIEDTAESAQSLSSPLGNVACAALMRETGAEVAIVGQESFKAGLPAGELSLQTVYDVLPTDRNIACYEISGEELAELVEELLQENDAESVPAYSVGGISCTIDWNNPAGHRASEIVVGNGDIGPSERYTLAVTEEFAESSELLKRKSRDIMLLWGSPADALRTFVLQPGWEDIARAVVGDKTVIEKAAPEASTARSEEGPFAIPMVPLAIAIIALGAVAIGFFVTVRTRR